MHMKCFSMLKRSFNIISHFYFPNRLMNLFVTLIEMTGIHVTRYVKVKLIFPVLNNFLGPNKWIGYFFVSLT